MKPTKYIPTNRAIDINQIDPEITEELAKVLNQFDTDNPNISFLEFYQASEELREFCKIPEAPLAQTRFKQILQAIKNGYASPVQIATLIGTNRQTVANYLNQYPLLTMAINDAIMSKVDTVEETTFKNAIEEPRASGERMFLLRNWMPAKYNQDRKASLAVRGNVNNIQININPSKIEQTTANNSRRIEGSAELITD